MLAGRGARRHPAVNAVGPHGPGRRLLQLLGRLHDHRGRNGHPGRALSRLVALAQPEPVDRGIGIIVLFVAIAPQAGFGATQLRTAEAATPVQERITPRIRSTVKVLAFVYGGLTLGAAPMCSIISASSISWSTLSTIWRTKLGFSSKISCASCSLTLR